jgi:polar amino acid transport system substrate-binding protein
MRQQLSRRSVLLGGTAAAVCSLTPGSSRAAQEIRMGYFATYAPYSVRNEETAMAGLLIDATNMIGRKAGFDISHHGFPWARAQLMVKEGQLDAFCTNPTVDRRAYALFCETPVIEPRIGVFHVRGHSKAEQLSSREGLKSLKIGDFIGNGWAKQHLADFNIQWMNTEELVLRNIAAGRLDGFISQEITGRAKLKQMGLEDTIHFTPTPFLGHFHFTFGLRRSYPDAVNVIARIEAATQELIRAGQMQMVFDRYQAS